ncbi:MAG TPA: sigma-54 dependent transcriptional regulator [Longimicrobiaceae bacterium]|nr:sigma-54 dependent transcriptional regulator [Longimicrobiaceae bacterium]
MSCRILVVDDEPALRVAFEFHLTRSGYEVAVAESAEAALSMVHDFRPAIIITDIQMEEMSGLELLQRVGAAQPEVDVIVITAYEDMRSAIGAIRDGAYDYMVKPLDLDQLDMVLRRCLRDRAARRRLADEPNGKVADGSDLVVGRTPQMIEIYKTIGMLAGTRAPVLIRGETGTGKELVARAIHFNSPQAGEPFVAINCTAIAENLLESELFGHVRGAFTGAVGDRKGRFELAGAGTIFLDEIGDTAPAFQAKLLRVLQEREFYPVGGEKPRRTEARVIAATHRPIEELISQGTFREDLYFRLRVVEIQVPPLRERRDDIPTLAEHLLAKAAREIHKDVRIIPAPVMKALQSYDWPGNVREMENTLTRAAVLAHGPAISLESLGLGSVKPVAAQTAESRPEGVTLEAVERSHVERILQRTGGNKRRAARMLGISRPRLDRLLAKYDGNGNGNGNGDHGDED